MDQATSTVLAIAITGAISIIITVFNSNWTLKREKEQWQRQEKADREKWEREQTAKAKAELRRKLEEIYSNTAYYFCVYETPEPDGSLSPSNDDYSKRKIAHEALKAQAWPNVRNGLLAWSLTSRRMSN